MAPKHGAARALFAFFSDSTNSVCFSCRRTIALQRRQHRKYASAATAQVDSSATPLPISSPSAPLSSTTASTTTTNTTSHEPPPQTALGPQPSYAVHAGILLSRAPMLTRTLHPFENAFFLYQRRLNERLALPFTRYFYFKKGTPASVEWKRKIKDRLTPARDIGVYSAYGRESWNDEVLVGADLAEPDVQREMLLRDSQGQSPVADDDVAAPPEVEGERDEKEQADAAMDAADKVEEEAASAARKRDAGIERPADRLTAADRKGDETSLDRRGDRTLYLLVKDAGGRWVFPSARVEGREALHQAAERIIVQTGGPNMNTWVVGKVPVGHYAFNHPSVRDDAERNTKEIGEKVFFLKGRILAGQADLAENKLGATEFKWLAKEEIRKHVTTRYWSQVEDMLAER